MPWLLGFLAHGEDLACLASTVTSSSSYWFPYCLLLYHFYCTIFHVYDNIRILRISTNRHESPLVLWNKLSEFRTFLEVENKSWSLSWNAVLANLHVSWGSRQWFRKWKLTRSLESSRKGGFFWYRWVGGFRSWDVFFFKGKPTSSKWLATDPAWKMSPGEWMRHVPRDESPSTSLVHHNWYLWPTSTT